MDGTNSDTKPVRLFPLVFQLLLYVTGAVVFGFVLTAVQDTIQANVGLHSKKYEFLSECLHPMGGGLVRPGGTFPRLNDTFLSQECAQELGEYFADKVGQYWKDVAQVAQSAMEHFQGLSELQQPNPKRVIIFDIDETTLSNAEEWQQQLKMAAPQHHRSEALLWGRRSVKRSLTTTWLLSRHQEVALRPDLVHDHVSSSGVHLENRGSGSVKSPALKPMQALYSYLYTSGYSLAFITGRKESERESTVANLKEAGYGGLCASPAVNDLMSTEKEVTLIKGFSGEGTRQELQGRPLLPCYIALYLRKQNDTRLASVYKPEQRKVLEDRGYEIFGSFGDQFSDLDGTSSAPHSFKLPNPAYILL
ncbi:hypothetical protein CEUSTIGMA_g13938.t1 [Chlamydomonas eustigma]|uniref:Acid phosphatase n=1 Tax=Chlamydomonas eustigma TaxID=1157962 RepID=A0A250XTX6_9CHLO|nr:hypothetical protein CEUSTIGMA_g13938.t1 [Chlamydomonas eustigma]|eukprot:GAX86531.1 hypothetical protein CEUSTIGMA_g13938.t1 [Chlamydomonas eustigma]